MFVGVLLAQSLGLRAVSGGVVVPLLATQILWINLVTDGPPALALGIDPADEGLMREPPRPAGERVITPRMWRDIAMVGTVMATGTLFVLDASMPGGFFEGWGDLRFGQTMAFTTLMLFQMFNVVNSQSDEQSAFARLFHEPVAVGIDRAVGRTAGRGRLPPSPPARLRHGRSERRGLAALRRGGEHGLVGHRDQESADSKPSHQAGLRSHH